MKVRVTMKDPDTLQDAIEDAVKTEVRELGLTQAEAAAVVELRAEAVQEVASVWFEYGECLTVEIDTDAKTCVAVPIPGR